MASDVNRFLAGPVPLLGAPAVLVCDVISCCLLALPLIGCMGGGLLSSVFSVAVFLDVGVVLLQPCPLVIDRRCLGVRSRCLQKMLVEHITQFRAARLVDMSSDTWCARKVVFACCDSFRIEGYGTSACRGCPSLSTL